MNTEPAREFAKLIHEYAFLGQVGHTLCCSHTLLLARAFGDLLSPEGDATFAIGYDIRESSPSLAEAVSLGLRSGGHHVVHIGACTTPFLEWYTAQNSLRGGVMITGHCAPKGWNGMRLYGSGGQPVSATSVLDSMKITDLDRLFSRHCNPVLHHDYPLAAYAACLRQRLHPEQQIKLCINVSDGPAKNEFKALVAHYQQLRFWYIGSGLDSTQINDPFAKQSQAKLADSVISKGCHLGAAMDADGDRLAVTDDHGAPVEPHILGVLLAQALAKRHPGLRVWHDSNVSPDVLRVLKQTGLRTQVADGGPHAAWTSLHDGQPGFYLNGVGQYAFSEFPGTANALLALIELINHLSESRLSLSAMIKTIKKQSTDG